tara:strand:+ start:496 stop:1272 length:777 start_codon:yes stop_codon:yes gene_type:complete
MEMRSIMEWKPSILNDSITANQVYVWSVNLDKEKVHTEEFYGLLSLDEKEKASRFHFEKDRDRYILARGVLRKMLAFYLDKKPIEVSFDYNCYGKPTLTNDRVHENLRFNMSHSGGIALIAFSRGRKIGVDIERVNNEFDYDQIVQTFFSKNEIGSIKKTENDKRHMAFFRFWTRKEAFLKGIGEGLSYPMKEVDVFLQSCEDWSLIQTFNKNSGQEFWYGKDLFPHSGYAAAIAVQGNNCELTCREYFDDEEKDIIY